MDSGGRSIKSAERTLALFELFSREQRPFTVGHICDALKIPQASASMLLRNLAELGYLEYDRAARTFAPSIRVALLGSWIDRRFDQAGSIGARLDRLQRKVGETAYLAIQNGASAQYVISQRPEHPDQLEVDTGQYRSLTCSAPGRALLSLKPDAEVAAWARRCNAEATQERFKVREAEFLQLIHEVRANGYAQTEGDVTPGLGAIAMTFTSPMGGMPLAVGVGGPISRMRRKRRLVIESIQRFREAFADDVSPASGE
jgi:IclR family KDG regulon transcriptional repressor